MEKVLTKKELKEKLVDFLLYLYVNHFLDDISFDYEKKAKKFIKRSGIFRKESQVDTIRQVKTEQKEEQLLLKGKWDIILEHVCFLGVTQFVFMHDEKLYITKFRGKDGWSYPVEFFGNQKT